MKVASQLDHVAVLVSSAREAAARSALVGAAFPYEEFPSEGTGEIYVGGEGRSARLLLVEPVGPGPYLNALAKRGPGLHHVGLVVTDVRAFVEGLAGSGWLLHPKSVGTIDRQRTAWLARPGVGLLVEVHERVALKDPPAITSLELPGAMCAPALLQALQCPALASSQSAPARLVTPAGAIQISDIIR